MHTNDLALKIGSRVKSSRLYAGLTQEQLAEKISVSWSAISNLERGHHMVSLERLIDIAKALNVGLETILCDYIDCENLYSDSDTQEINKQLTLLTPKQKKYVVKNLHLIIDIFSY